MIKTHDMEFKLFRGLKSRELEFVNAHLLEKRVRKGERLFEEGHPCENIFFVVAGRLKLFRVSETGREQTLDVFGPGGSCVCHPGILNWRCGANAEALSDAVILVLRREDYDLWLQTNPKIVLALSHHLAERLRSFASLVHDMSLKNVPQRLARLLLLLADEQGTETARGRLFEVGFSRAFLASRIGTSRETLVRMLYMFKRKKFIDITGRSMTLLNKAGLEKVAHPEP